MCVFPFIPKTSKNILNTRKALSMSLFSLDFQNRMCHLRERAKQEGLNWIKEPQINKSVLTIKEQIHFKEFLTQADVKGRVYLLKIYQKKTGEGKLYKFKVEMNYQLKNCKEKVPFYYYFTLEA